MLKEIFHDSFENFEIYKDFYGKPFKRNWVPCWRTWDSVRQEKNEPHLKLRRLHSNYALFVAELSCARSAQQSTMVRKFGNQCIREILVVT